VIPARRVLAAATIAAALLASALAPAPAFAAKPPVWRIDALTNTTIAPGGTSRFLVEIKNVANNTGESTSGQFTFTASLPAGIKATGLSVTGPPGIFGSATNCAATAFPSASVTCTDSEAIPQQTKFVYSIPITAAAGLKAGAVKTASFAVSGAGAGSASAVATTTLAAAPPPFGLAALDGATTDGPGGAAETQAGAHPYDSSLTFEINTHESSRPLEGPASPVEPLRDVVAELPPGLVGNPTVADQCTDAELLQTQVLSPVPTCPTSSQLGTTLVRLSDTSGTVGLYFGPLPVYNMVPPPGVPARFAFNVFGSVVVLDARLRSGSDYGISITSDKIPEAIPVIGTTTTLWGSPFSTDHDAERSCPGKGAAGNGNPSCASGAAAELSFLRNPTSCAGPEALSTTMHVDSWLDPGALTADGEPDLSDPAWASRSYLAHAGPGYPHPPGEWGETAQIEHCANVPFEPSISLQPTTNAADSPTGLDFDLTMPQAALEEPAAIAQADVKDSVVTQPLGMRVNPATADGLLGCSEAQIGYLGNKFPAPNPVHFSVADPACPDSSKIGTVEILSPLQEEPMHGAIYQARQDENPFGSTLAFYAVAKGQGLIIKLPALVQTDPETGQVSTVFKDSPQLPFTHYRLHFFGGPRAPLITPPTCGTYTSHGTFSGWANPGQPAHTEDSFKITSGPNGTPCANTEAERPFAPSFEAGTVNPLSGAFSPFVLKLGREDGMQELTGLETTLPPGLIGRLAGVAECSDAQLAAAAAAIGLAERTVPSCPAASKVGVADAAAGAGPNPFHNPGTAYLAGPYKGAPLSLAIVTPAVAGPLDLGTVVVRAALFVDPVTTQIHAVSDPLPTRILKGGDGFPLDLRQVVVQLDRPDFTLNPTSCDPMAVSGVVGGSGGASAPVSNRFQAASCDRLAFKPKLALSLRGGTTRSAHPGLRATLTMPASGANIATASVALPHSEFLAQSHIKTICTRVQFAADACPAGSIYGTARAISPLLDQPLEGPVYLRSSSNPLPDLVAALHGQIDVDLLGRIDSKNGGIRTTFETVPDAPVTKFTLTMPGGKKSLLENSTDICRSANKATVQFGAQNGKLSDSRPVVHAKCPKKKATPRRFPDATDRTRRVERGY
jgi:hypothetical protein